MKSYRITGLVGYAAPIGAYIFFLLQFYVQAPTAAHWLASVLTVIGLPLVPSHDADNALKIAVALFLPYLIIVGLYRAFFFDIYARLTIVSRLPAFDEAVGQITRYHQREPATLLLADVVRENYPNERIKSATSRTMIDLLITDLRDAFEDLCMCSDIRVAVYINAKLDEDIYNYQRLTPYDGSNNDADRALRMLATTEFDKIYEHSTKFGRLNTTRKFEGYCGEAWNLRKPISGAPRKFWFFHDKSYLNYNVLDKNRSFLCLPVMLEVRGRERVFAIISIDSGRAFDLWLSRDLREAIFVKTHSIRDILWKYLSCMY